MKTPYFIMLICCLIVLSACERYSNVYYVINNQTEDHIGIHYLDESQYNSPGRTDAKSIVLFPNQKDTIYYVELNGGSKVTDPETSKRMQGVYISYIMRLSDTTMVIKDANLKENWLYDKTGKETAVIELTVSEADF